MAVLTTGFGYYVGRRAGRKNPAGVLVVEDPEPEVLDAEAWVLESERTAPDEEFWVLGADSPPPAVDGRPPDAGPRALNGGRGTSAARPGAAGQGPGPGTTESRAGTAQLRPAPPMPAASPAAQPRTDAPRKPVPQSGALFTPAKRPAAAPWPPAAAACDHRACG